MHFFDAGWVVYVEWQFGASDKRKGRYERIGVPQLFGTGIGLEIERIG